MALYQERGGGLSLAISAQRVSQHVYSTQTRDAFVKRCFISTLGIMEEKDHGGRKDYVLYLSCRSSTHFKPHVLKPHPRFCLAVGMHRASGCPHFH